MTFICRNRILPIVEEYNLNPNVLVLSEPRFADWWVKNMC